MITNSRILRRLYLAITIAFLIGGAYLIVGHNRHTGGLWRSETTQYSPNPSLTPGVAATGDRDTICNRSTKAVRDVTPGERKEVLRRYGLKDRHDGWCGEDGCELDHLQALEMGGSNDIANLWPQPYQGMWNAHMKDRLENQFHKMICNGDIDAATAQHEISTDWIAAYKKYVTK